MGKEIKTIEVKLHYKGFKQKIYMIPIEKREDFVDYIKKIINNRWKNGTELERKQFINSLIQEIYFVSESNVEKLAELELGGEKYEDQEFIEDLIKKKKQWNRGETIEFEKADNVSQYAEQIGHILLLYLQKKVQEKESKKRRLVKDELESIKNELYEQIFSIFVQMPSRTDKILRKVENFNEKTINTERNNEIVSLEDKQNWEKWYFRAKDLGDEMIIVAEGMTKQKSEYLSATDKYTAEICKVSFNRQQKELEKLYKEYYKLKKWVEDLPEEVGERIQIVQNDNLYQELINTTLSE